MTFVSLEFMLLLAITFAAFYFFPQRGRMLLLLVASYVFYCYWNPWYAILIFASTLLDYVMAIAISRSKSQRGRKLAVLTSIVGNLGILGYFKYTNFALDSLRALLGPLGMTLPGPLELILPVGISFYTFQTMSYTIDVYRGHKDAEYDFFLVALYVSFFPQLVAGPIERAKDLMPQLAIKQPFHLQNIEEGGRLILWGFLKKAVISDRLTYAAYPAFLQPSAYSTGELVFSAAAMVIVIYLDFSAYSEIARGVAQLFGIRLSVNFDFPQTAVNIADFWRRWHITMSTWVRDYLYIPLGGFRPRHVWSNFRITLITMGLVGLWHGAQWTFVIWGLLHGFFLVLYHVLHLRVLRHWPRSVTRSLPWRFGSWVLIQVMHCVLVVLFFAPSMKHVAEFYSGMLVHMTPGNYFGFGHPYVLLGCALLIAFWIIHYVHAKTDPARWLHAMHPALRAALYVAIIHVILFGAVVSSEQFIYFQF